MNVMQLFKWTKAHAVFLPEVDAEHRNLFRLAEELHQAVESGAETARLGDAMQSLLAAVEEHFAHEERLMKAARCESYEWHKQQHDTARKKAKQAFKAFTAGDAAAPGELLTFLAHWLREHMGLTDRMMGAEVRNSGRLAAKAS